ncbi:30S ribosomal subunit protein S17 [Candidatus Zixiibacteriota bacterium]|nr:30S ribosomal subunit protein S17 [candidate division Zixibacteria bacterium]
MNRSMRKIRFGRVISDKMEKTVIVKTERTMKHPLYNRIVKTFSKFYAHDEKNEAHVGDLVKIMETRPLSALKRWRLVEVIEKAK